MAKLTFDMDGYFQTIIWFWEYPRVLTSSFTFLHQARLQTCNRKRNEDKRTNSDQHKSQRCCSELWQLACLPVSIEFSMFPLAVFLNLTYLSAVSPPDATRLCWCGDQAVALTAAYVYCELVVISTGCHLTVVMRPFQPIDLQRFITSCSEWVLNSRYYMDAFSCA